MRKYYELSVAGIADENADSRRLTLHVPDALRETFSFLPGQHLPLSVTLDGEELHRTYSICSAPGEWPLELGIRVQPGGKFSETALSELRAGDAISVMPPFGRFHADVDASNSKHYVAFAAGSCRRHRFRPFHSAPHSCGPSFRPFFPGPWAPLFRCLTALTI